VKCEAYYTGAKAIPLGLAPKADPERQGYETDIQPKGLGVNREEIAEKLEMKEFLPTFLSKLSYPRWF